jgi:hypothetical protein
MTSPVLFHISTYILGMFTPPNKTWKFSTVWMFVFAELYTKLCTDVQWNLLITKPPGTEIFFPVIGRFRILYRLTQSLYRLSHSGSSLGVLFPQYLEPIQREDGTQRRGRQQTVTVYHVCTAQWRATKDFSSSRRQTNRHERLRHASNNQRFAYRRPYVAGSHIVCYLLLWTECQVHRISSNWEVWIGTVFAKGDARTPTRLLLTCATVRLHTVLLRHELSIYIYLFIYIYLATYLYISLFIYIYLYLFIYIYLYLFISIYLYLSSYLSIYIYLYLFTSIYIYLFIYIYIYLFISI